MGLNQKLRRKIALLEAYLRGEDAATRHKLVQFGQSDHSEGAVQAKLAELRSRYEHRNQRGAEISPQRPVSSG